MSAILFDTEVNGLKAMEPIEVAWCSVEIGQGGMSVGEIERRRYKPEAAFEAGAVALHMIIPDDVMECGPSRSAAIPEAEYIIGHNVDFDALVMKNETSKRICTEALCRHFWPHFDSFKLGSVYVELYGQTADVIRVLKEAHSAEFDVSMCIDVLAKIINVSCVTTMEELYQLSEVARVPTVFTFGKHKGTRIADVDRGYKKWLMSQPDVDPYLMKALRQ